MVTVILDTETSITCTLMALRDRRSSGIGTRSIASGGVWSRTGLQFLSRGASCFLAHDTRYGLGIRIHRRAPKWIPKRAAQLHSLSQRHLRPHTLLIVPASQTTSGAYNKTNSNKTKKTQQTNQKQPNKMPRYK